VFAEAVDLSLKKYVLKNQIFTGYIFYK